MAWIRPRTSCIVALFISGLVAPALTASAIAAAPAPAPQTQPAVTQALFDFENPGDAQSWSALDDPKAKVKEPAESCYEATGVGSCLRASASTRASRTSTS